jgi:hypothetical protein
MLNRLVTVSQAVIIVIFLIIVLLPTLIGLKIFLWIFDVPRKVGQRLDFEGAIRAILYRVVDPQEMRRFRDETLHILESEVEVEGKPDRWGILREIDESQSEIERRLKNGEFAFSFIGSIAALIVGNLLGIVIGGILLTVVGLLFSFLVTSRIIITDVLCFRSINVRNEPMRRLMLFKGWNRGPIFGSGAIGVAVVSAIASRDGMGYRLGRKIMESYAVKKYGGENKWRAE